LRRNLGSLTDLLEDFTVVLNYTFVDSQISIDPNETVFTNPERPLVGQPDNVMNAILEWTRLESGSLVRLLVNFTDDKIARGGGFGQPDVLEEARTTVDLVYRQDLDFWLKGLSLKLSASNLFNEEWEWTQGGEIFRRFDPGRSISLSASFNVF
jgi:outer membrane receptor protein involved in Fe transport